MGASEKSAATFHPDDRPTWEPGQVECEGCGKRVWLVTHSCTGVRPVASPDGLARRAGAVRQDRRRVIAEAILSIEDVIWQEATDVIAWCAADAVLAALPTPDAYQALLTQLHEARAEAARETRRADAAERDLSHIVGRAQHHLDRANAAETREAALRSGIAGLIREHFSPGDGERVRGTIPLGDLRALLVGEVRP